MHQETFDAKQLMGLLAAGVGSFDQNSLYRAWLRKLELERCVFNHEPVPRFSRGYLENNWLKPRLRPCAECANCSRPHKGNPYRSPKVALPATLIDSLRSRHGNEAHEAHLQRAGQNKPPGILYWFGASRGWVGLGVLAFSVHCGQGSARIIPQPSGNVRVSRCPPPANLSADFQPQVLLPPPQLHSRVLGPPSKSRRTQSLHAGLRTRKLQVCDVDVKIWPSLALRGHFLLLFVGLGLLFAAPTL